MPDIDAIMRCFDWNNSESEQLEGLRMAKEIKCLSAFFQPLNLEFNKNVWDNCAKVLYERSDCELKPYLSRMFEWIKDLNWPGALCIMERLHSYKRELYFEAVLEEYKKIAIATGDQIWFDNLLELEYPDQ